MRCCASSIVVGVIFCWTNIVTPSRSGRTKYGSGAERSAYQNANGAR